MLVNIMETGCEVVERNCDVLRVGGKVLGTAWKVLESLDIGNEIQEEGDDVLEGEHLEEITVESGEDS